MECKEWIRRMCEIPSVSGRESAATPSVTELLKPYFDEIYTDAVGNVFALRRSGKENARRILIDTHIDEIGMAVTEVCEGGFLRATNLGGLDARTLQASEVQILGKYGAEYGIIGARPPHLSTKEEREKLEKIDALYIDTGYTKKEAEEHFPIGTAVRFAPAFAELLNGRIAGTSFDNKACAAVAAYALSKIPKETLAGDVALLLSVREESSRASLGASVGGFSFRPDVAAVLDVDLGEAPDTPKFETVKLGGGISVAVAASMSRTLTKNLIRKCEQEKIPYQVMPLSGTTGTNGEGVRLAGEGIPTAVVGLPLCNMHTPGEIVALPDAEALARFVTAFVTDGTLAGGDGA